MVREQILALEVSAMGSVNPAFYMRKQAATIAEARERELLAEKAALIAELQEAVCRKEGKDDYAVVPALIIENILAKYEASP